MVSTLKMPTIQTFMSEADEDDFSKILKKEMPEIYFVDVHPMGTPNLLIKSSISECREKKNSACAIVSSKICSKSFFEKNYIFKIPSREEYHPADIGKGIIQFLHSDEAGYEPGGLRDGGLAASYDSVKDPDTDAFVKAVWKLCKQHGQKLYAITDMKAGTVSPKPHGRFIGWPDAIAKFDRVGDLYLTNNTMAYFTSKPG